MSIKLTEQQNSLYKKLRIILYAITAIGLLYFTKEIKHNHYMSDDEDNLFETEDLSINGYFKKLNLT